MKNLFFTIILLGHIWSCSSVFAQTIQNGGFEDGPTATNISQIYNADFWYFGCEDLTSLYDCDSPPISGGPFAGASPVDIPANCISPRTNGFDNCRFGSIRCRPDSNGVGGSPKNELSGIFQANVTYEIQAFVARGNLPTFVNQPNNRRIEALLRVTNDGGACQNEIVIPIPTDIPYGNCSWMPISAYFQLNPIQAAVGYNFIEFREVPQYGHGYEEIYIDDVSLSRVAGLSNLSLETVKIYPNPANTELHIETENKFSRAIVTDLLGKELMVINDSKTIYLENLSTGVYIIQLVSDNGYETYSQRFIKQ